MPAFTAARTSGNSSSTAPLIATPEPPQEGFLFSGDICDDSTCARLSGSAFHPAALRLRQTHRVPGALALDELQTLPSWFPRLPQTGRALGWCCRRVLTFLNLCLRMADEAAARVIQLGEETPETSLASRNWFPACQTAFFRDGLELRLRFFTTSGFPSGRRRGLMPQVEVLDRSRRDSATRTLWASFLQPDPRRPDFRGSALRDSGERPSG